MTVFWSKDVALKVYRMHALGVGFAVAWHRVMSCMGRVAITWAASYQSERTDNGQACAYLAKNPEDGSRILVEPTIR